MYRPFFSPTLHLADAKSFNIHFQVLQLEDTKQTFWIILPPSLYTSRALCRKLFKNVHFFSRSISFPEIDPLLINSDLEESKPREMAYQLKACLLITGYNNTHVVNKKLIWRKFSIDLQKRKYLKLQEQCN